METILTTVSSNSRCVKSPQRVCCEQRRRRVDQRKSASVEAAAGQPLLLLKLVKPRTVDVILLPHLRSSMAKNDDDNELSSIPTTRFARTKKLTGLTAKVGLSTLAGKMSRAFMSDENAITSRLASQLKNTQQIVQTLSEMKGAAMKLGQMLSLHGDHLFPKEVTQILSTLQSESKFISFQEIHKILEKELGADYATRLLDLSQSPIAAASIGQVHKACTTDGTWVAVKVQYPGVEQSIDSDVDTLSSLLKLVSQIPNAEDFSPVVEEIKNVLKA